MDIDPGLAMFGPFQLVCEIDAKPAGTIGFIRVFVSKEAPELSALGETFAKAFAGNPSDVESRPATIAGTQGVEVRYRSSNHDNRAFAVRLGDTTYVVVWGGLDQSEYEAGLPAYVLARNSARAS